MSNKSGNKPLFGRGETKKHKYHAVLSLADTMKETKRILKGIIRQM